MKGRHLQLFSIALFSILMLAQESHRRPLPDVPPEPPARVQPQHVDSAQLKQEADEIAKLAQSLPSDVQLLEKGLLAKDLSAKLKRIEKLSKQLRKDIASP